MPEQQMRMNLTLTSDDGTTITATGEVTVVGQQPDQPPTEPPIEPPASEYPDGSAGAPRSTNDSRYSCFYASLLESYVKRPPWKVAGVDYPVGIRPEALPLTPVRNAQLPAGASLSNNCVVIDRSNVTLRGLDFSAAGNNNGGITVRAVGGLSNVVLEDCYFCPTTNQQHPIEGSRSGLKLRYCSVDGNNVSTDFSCVFNKAYLAEWCYFNFAQQDTFNYGATENGQGQAQTLIVRYCAILNTGTTGGHADVYQCGGSDGNPWDPQLTYSLIYQEGQTKYSANQQGTQGWMFEPEDNAPGVTGVCSNNVWIIKRKQNGEQGPMNFISGIKGGKVAAPGVKIQENYIMQDGLLDSHAIRFIGTMPSSVLVNNNWDMKSGKKDRDAGFNAFP